eukprot:scaffold501_cov407-Prasinococcus_capsulatus_cf.AAC.16
MGIPISFGCEKDVGCPQSLLRYADPDSSSVAPPSSSGDDEDTLLEVPRGISPALVTSVAFNGTPSLWTVLSACRRAQAWPRSLVLSIIGASGRSFLVRLLPPPSKPEGQLAAEWRCLVLRSAPIVSPFARGCLAPALLAVQVRRARTSQAHPDQPSPAAAETPTCEAAAGAGVGGDGGGGGDDVDDGGGGGLERATLRVRVAALRHGRAARGHAGCT